MEHISLAPQVLFEFYGWPITNSIVATWLAILVLMIIGIITTRKMSVVPKGIQNVMEAVIEALLGLMDSVTNDRQKSEKFFPWVATFFIFIVTANWMELIPGFGSIGLEKIDHGKVELIPFLRSANTDLNTTLAMGIISVILAQVFGIIFIGFFKHVGKFINFRGPIDFFVGILEFIGELARVISFAFRLFGNIFAGEVLLVVIAFLIPYIAPLPFYGLELFVGFIQALVFAMLTLVFLTMATMEHGHE